MPIKPEDVLSVIGFEKLDSFEKPEDLKVAFDKKFIARDRVAEDEEISSQMTGRLFGTLATDIKKEFKKAGIEFDSSEVDIKNKKAGEIVGIGIGKIVGSFQEQIDTLKAASGGDASKEIEKLTKKMEKITGELTQEKELRLKAVEEIEGLKTGFDGEKKSWKVDQMTKEIFGQVKYKNGLPKEAMDLMKTGFESSARSRYKFDLDDKGELVVLTADGKKVEDKKTSGKTLSPLEALKSLAVEKGVWEDNPNNGKQVRTEQFGASGGQDQPKRKLHPGLEAMKARGQ